LEILSPRPSIPLTADGENQPRPTFHGLDAYIGRRSGGEAVDDQADDPILTHL